MMATKACCMLALLLLLETVNSIPVALTIRNVETQPFLARHKRQAGDRNQVINSIFQIPIQTLTAVSTLVQSTRPIFPNRFNRESIIPNVFSRPGGVPSRGPQSVGAAAVQVKPARDGSSFKI